ncbi:MFS transporter [Clohesyomyces aquaticus]|uniref:MFS transporter n=1 Tax=Clohesyomyces aquaticus TaxID=1231657 RepID=A0A1Y1YUG7_9PLEO|nr:MFS transporter [Clohesyomyces aquaticus]
MVHFNKFDFWSICFLSFGAFFYGYDSGLTTSIIGYPQFISYFGFNSNLIGALGSFYYAGSFVGSGINFWLPDRYGRKPTIYVACVVAVVGAILQTAAINIEMLFVGRVIGGIASGIVFGVCPMFMSEISPPEFRGRVGGLYSLNINLGYTLTEWMGLGFSYINSDVAWRLFLGLQFVPPFVIACACPFLPESPRYLIVKGHYDEALDIIKRLHGGVSGQDDDFYIREFNQIKAQHELEVRERLGLRAVLRKPSYRKRMFIVVFQFAFAMFTGIIPLQNYQFILYTYLGVTNKMALVMVGVWGTLGTIFCIFGALTCDKLGRRKALLLSLWVQFLASIAMVIYFRKHKHAPRPLHSRLHVPLPHRLRLHHERAFGYPYPSEIMTTPIRAAGNAVSFCTFNAITIMLVQVTPIAIERIAWRYFLIFIICDAIFIVVVWWVYPETVGKTLEEIAALFEDEVAVDITEAHHYPDTKSPADEKVVNGDVTMVERISNEAENQQVTNE